MITQEFNIDFVPGRRPVEVHVKQGDYGERTLTANLFSNDSPFTLPSGVTVIICGTKPSGKGFYYDNIATVSNGRQTVSFDCTKQMTVVSGKVAVGILVKNSSGVVQSARFYLVVEPAALSDKTVVDSNVFTGVVDDAVAEYLSTSGMQVVRYDQAQTLTETQKARARDNIEAPAAARTLMYIGVLDSGEDLDDYTTPGIYNCTHYTEYENYPASGAGKLTVYGSHTGNNIMIAQVLTSTENDGPVVYLRTSTSGGVWKDWTRMIDAEDLEAAIARVPSYIGQLKADEDLNDYTTPGTYNCTDITNLQNYPAGSTGKLLVLGTHTGNNILCTQLVFAWEDSSAWWRCSNGSGVWNDWERIAERRRAPQFLGVLPAETDLDTLVSPGVWNVNAYASMTNWPSDKPGRLLVFGNVSGNSILTVQAVFDTRGRMYYRISPSNGTWLRWYQTERFGGAGLAEPFSVASPVNDYAFDGDVTDIAAARNDVAALYGMYDALQQAHPEYMSQAEVLGKDESGEYDILCYTIEPFPNSGKPEVLFISNVHGDEPNAAMSTYYMCREILENWETDPTLRMLFSNVCLRVIPLGNPWGYQNNNRLNSNGVNLNRDYPVKWSYVDPGIGEEPNRNATGLYSMSQKETQVIMDFVEAHKQKALVLVNKHDTGYMKGKDTTDANRYVGYFSTNDIGSRAILTGAGSALDAELRASESDWLNAETFPNFMRLSLFPTKDASTGGTLNLYSSYIGIPSFLLEVCIGSTTSSRNRADLCQISVTADVTALAAYIIHNAEAIGNTDQITRFKAYTGDGEGGSVQIEYDPETGTWG